MAKSKKAPQRKRQVDVEKMDDQTLEKTQAELSKKVMEIVDKACEDANKLLNIYGLQAKMQIALEEKEQ
jgi:hypothetical protein